MTLVQKSLAWTAAPSQAWNRRDRESAEYQTRVVKKGLLDYEDAVEAHFAMNGENSQCWSYLCLIERFISRSLLYFSIRQCLVDYLIALFAMMKYCSDQVLLYTEDIEYFQTPLKDLRSILVQLVLSSNY